MRNRASGDARFRTKVCEARSIVELCNRPTLKLPLPSEDETT